MGKYRGLNITGGLNANFRKIKVRKTVDTESLQDRGTIAEAASDLPTRGAAHRRGRGALKSQRKAATGATRGSISMGWITGDDSNVIDEHDYGYIFQNTETNDRAAWETRRALGVAASIADEQSANAQQVSYATGVSLYNSTAIIPAGTPLILNSDGTVSAVTGGSEQGAGLSTTYDNPNSTGDLGRSASISDTYVAATDATSGTVSIFNRETGTHIRTHTKSADSSERWGWTVANSDDYVVVGDASPDYARQVLDVWRLSDGASMTTIYYPFNGNNMFPGSVAIYGNKILAGAWQTPGQNAGTGAYLWNAQNGSLLRSYSRDIADAAHFGRAVTMNSTYAFVWSPRWYPQSLGYDEVPAKVHMFTFTSNNAVQRYPISWYGGHADATMDCDETHVIIGGGGKAGIIDIATGNLVHEFVPPDGEASHVFGRDVSIDGNYAAVSGNGKVFVYEVPTGNLLATLEDPDGNALTFYSQVIRARSNGDILVANRIAADGGKVYKYTIGEIQTTNLTEDNYIGFAKDDFGSAGSLGRVVSIGGTIGGFTGLTIGADYWIQNDGSVSTIETDVYAGQAISATEIQLKYATGTWQGERGVFLNSGQYINFSTLGSATNFPVSIGGPSDVVNSGFSDGTTVFGSSYNAFGTYANMVTLSTAEPMAESTSYGRQNRGITAVGNGITGFSAAGAGYDYQSGDYEWTDRTNNIYAINMVTKVGGAVTGTLRTTPYAMTGNNNTTRAFFSGGSYGSTSVQALTFETGGDSSYFGHTLGLVRRWAAGAGNEDKAFILGGYMTTQTGGALNSTEGFDTQTAGNSVSLGSLTVQREGNVSISDGTYIITAGGANTYGYGRTGYVSADRLNISTAATAEDFGDLGSSQYKSAGASGNSA